VKKLDLEDRPNLMRFDIDYFLSNFTLMKKIKQSALKILLFNFAIILCLGCLNKTILEKEVQHESYITSNQLQQITSEATGNNIVLIRHAEKMTDVSDPGLTKEGQARASNLVSIFRNTELSAIYSTDYNRTKNTIAVLSENKSLTPILYEANNPELFAEQLFETHVNQTILIVGHSNTTPNLIQGILKTEDLEVIHHDEYDNFYFINANGVGQGKLTKYKY